MPSPPPPPPVVAAPTLPSSLDTWWHMGFGLRAMVVATRNQSVALGGFPRFHGVGCSCTRDWAALPMDTLPNHPCVSFGGKMPGCAATDVYYLVKRKPVALCYISHISSGVHPEHLYECRRVHICKESPLHGQCNNMCMAPLTSSLIVFGWEENGSPFSIHWSHTCPKSSAYPMFDLRLWQWPNVKATSAGTGVNITGTRNLEAFGR